MVELIFKYLVGLYFLISVDCLVRDKRQVQYCITPDNYRGYCTTLTNCQQVALLYSQNAGSNRIRQYLFGLRSACNNAIVRGDPVVCCAQGNNNNNALTATPPNIIVETPNRNSGESNQGDNNLSQFCVTPDNYRGYCTQLSTCQHLQTLSNQYGSTSQFRQFLVVSRNACNNAVVRNDPVVCCNQNNAVAPPATTIKPSSVTLSPKVESNGSCRGPDSITGTCISLVECPVLLTRLEKNPGDAQYAQFLRDSNVACGRPAPIICCPRAGTNSVPTSPPKNNKNFIVTDRLPTPEEGCGLVTDQLFKKVVGGQPAKPGDWPWIALLGYTDSSGENAFKCGGALITSKHILTAAHCLRKDLKFVRLGENDLSIETETEYMDIPIEKTYIHPKYDRKDGHSDIAVLRLTRNAPYTSYIRFACLPYDTALRTKSYVDLNPFVAGWGKTQEDGKSAIVLQEIQVPVLRNDECISRYSAENRYISSKQFDDSVLCAGVLTGGVDTCQGDSGGPLVQPELYSKDRSKLNYYVIGVVSYGIGCARPNIPGVYTNVPKFIDWIQQQIKDTT